MTAGVATKQASRTHTRVVTRVGALLHGALNGAHARLSVAVEKGEGQWSDLRAQGLAWLDVSFPSFKMESFFIR